MRFLRRIAGFLGFADDHEEDDDHNNASSAAAANNHNHQASSKSRTYHETGLPRKGFGVSVQVAVERSQAGPVIVHCTSSGGVQGMRWYGKRLRIDEDGDVADEFLEEVLPETSVDAEDEQRTLPKFQIKYSTRPAKVKNQAISYEGKIQQSVEFQGRLQWV